MELTINSQGFFSYKGHLHNSGFVGYSFAVASAIQFQDDAGRVLVASKEGHVGGTTSADDRDDNWADTGISDVLRANWDRLRGAGMVTRLR